MRLDYTRLRVGIGEKLEKALEKAAHVATKYFKIASYESVWQGGVVWWPIVIIVFFGKIKNIHA